MKICIIGAGRRVHEMYVPVLSSLENVEVSGVWNRTPSKLSSLSAAVNWRCYEDQKRMIEECKPDALLVVVNSSSIKSVVLDLMKYNIPIIMETPVWDKEIPEVSTKKNLMVMVNEQTPYLPCEEFKMMLLETGKFGSPVVAVNDFRTFEFHGIAQLRRYVGYEKTPIEVVGSCLGQLPISYCDNNNNLQHHAESWEFGVIKFSSGQAAVYNFSSIYNRAPFRKPRSTRIYCSRGTITSDDNDFKVHILVDSGETREVKVAVVGDYMKTESIEAKVGDLGVKWSREERLNHLNDQQIAIREVMKKNLEAVSKRDASIGYSSLSAFTDVNLLNAIRFSSQSKKFLL